jgi:hypothetical protein
LQHGGNLARNARPNSPTHLNSTLNRPMASQGGTRYEDRTMGRPQQAHPHNNGAIQQPQYHVRRDNLSFLSRKQCSQMGQIFG